jgi:DNA-binding SARP family transcriptional activator
VRQLGVVLSRRVGQAVGLWGEPGIGKTYTAQQVLREVPCQSMSLHATAQESAIAKALPRPKRFPVWAEAQLERALRGESVDARAFVDALTAILAGLAPFVLHLEDLHEASPERLELIVALAQAVTRTKGVSLLVTSRSEPPEPFRNQHLEPLRDEETTGLLEREVGANLPQEGLAWIRARTRGNPLFALEFARYLTRQGFLWSDGQHWHWRVPPEGFVPVTIEAMISQLVLSQAATLEARAVLESRAILPMEFTDEGIWAIVAGVGLDLFNQERSMLERAGVLSHFEFTHPLIGEVTLRELPAQRRREYAKRAIVALEDASPELAATFIDDAGLSDTEALALLERAASRAQEQDDTMRAARLLGIAAGYATGGERVRLALQADAALTPIGEFHQRERLGRLALEAQPENREARLALGHTLAQLGRLTEVDALLAGLPEAERRELRWVDLLFRAQAMAQQPALAILTWGQHPDLSRQPNGRSVFYAVQAYCDLGEFAPAEALTVRTLEQPNLHLRTRGLLVNSLAYIRSAQGRYQEAQVLHDESVALNRQEGHLSNLATSLYERAINLDHLGCLEEAQGDITEAIELYDHSGNAREAANARAFFGYLLTRCGDFPQAEGVLLEAHDVNARFGVSINRINCERELSLLYAEWQPLHGAVLALKFARDAVDHMRSSGYAQLTSHVLSAAACVASQQGDGPSAMAFATEALEALGDQDSGEERYWCMVALARALEANLDPAQALERWREAHTQARDLGLQIEMFETELEIARLGRDRQRGLELLEWFDQRGLGSLALRARRYFPHEEPLPVLTSASGVRLEVLGAIRLCHDDRPVLTRARKRLEILAYLLETRIAGRSEASALEIVDALYPDEPEIEARNTLKQQVYLIRSSLGQDSIISTPNGYALSAVSSDAEDFLRTADVGLWRGAYLSGLGPGWVSSVRDALALALRSSIELLLEVDPGEAARLGQILCEMEPYDPDALSLAVRALEVSGDDRGARRRYLEGRTRLLEVGESLPASLDAFLAVVPA